VTYQTSILLEVFSPGKPGREILSWDGFRAYMLSALIPSERSYPAMPLMQQQVH